MGEIDPASEHTGAVPCCSHKLVLLSNISRRGERIDEVKKC